MTRPGPRPFRIEFWKDENGREPVRQWLKELPATLRRAAGIAMNEQLQQLGVDVCESGSGRHVASGVFEFRVSRDPRSPEDRREPARVLLRIFCHAYGDSVILLLGAYDKASDPSRRRQQAEIAIAKARLAAWRERSKREG